MANQHIGDMSLDDLNRLIEQVVDRRLHTIFHTEDTRTIDEINESIRRNRWTPPPGAKSSLELLREDRDA